MKTKNEFEGIGKITPYKVPEGFFSQLSTKTLEKAQRREHRVRQLRSAIGITLTAAASVAILFLFVWQDKNPQVQPEKSSLAVNTQAPVPFGMDSVVGHNNPNTVPPVARPAQLPVKEKAPQVRTEEPVQVLADQPVQTIVQLVTVQKQDENLDELLNELSDDEVLQLAAMLDSDPFIVETIE